VLVFDLAGPEEGRLLARDDPLAWVLRVAREVQADLPALRELVAAATRRVERLEREEGPCWARILLAFLAVLLFHERPQEDYDVLLGTIRDSLQDRTRRLEMETLRKSAAETNLERGLERGQQKARRETLIEMLEKRFCAGPDVVARVAAIGDPERLSAILSQAIVANSLDEIDLPA
jgi:hypothetical protein